MFQCSNIQELIWLIPHLEYIQAILIIFFDIVSLSTLQTERSNNCLKVTYKGFRKGPWTFLTARAILWVLHAYLICIKYLSLLDEVECPGQAMHDLSIVRASDYMPSDPPSCPLSRTQSANTLYTYTYSTIIVLYW